jgi:uncharacterized protein YndB with AHSA1/START domain
MRTATVTTALDAPKDAVFAYLSDIENLPTWATEFARELRHDERGYTVVNGLGEFRFTMFQSPDMPDELFESQHDSLCREFRNIERIFGA